MVWPGLDVAAGWGFAVGSGFAVGWGSAAGWGFAAGLNTAEYFEFAAGVLNAPGKARYP